MDDEILFEALFFAAVFVVAFLSGLARLATSRGRQSFRYSFGLCSCVGFLAFAICSAACGNPASSDVFPWYVLGMASLIGALVKEQDKLRLAFAKKMGLVDEEPKTT